MLKGFRDFILRGNVLDLAVAVLIGAAFGQITASLTADVITPFISSVVGTPDFSALKVHIHQFNHAAHNPPPPCVPAQSAPCPHIPGYIYYGIFLNSIINFVLVSGVIYFILVLPVHKLMARIHGPDAITTKPCPQCLSDVPLAATRCKFCTQPV